MHQVRGVEELRNGSVDVLLSLIHSVGFLGFLGIILVVKLLAAGIRTVVINVRILTLPILLGEDL